MPLKAVESRRLYRQVADQLRELIDTGEFDATGRLPAERDLATNLNVSRPTVREALIVLEVEGRVSIRVGAGVFILPRPPANSVPDVEREIIEGPFELLRARQFIESAIAEAVAGVATREDVAELGAILDSAEEPDADKLAIDREFHVAVASILGNSVLSRFVGELFDQRINPYFEQLSAHFETDESWRLALAEHRIVHDAIASGDGAAARAAMQAHLEGSQQRFSKSFGEGPSGVMEES